MEAPVAADAAAITARVVFDIVKEMKRGGIGTWRQELKSCLARVNVQRVHT